MFGRVHHIAFIVGDLDAATDQFETQYELSPLMREEMTGDFELEVALYPVGDVLVELITPTTAEGWVYDFWRESGDGFFHIAFEVEDIRESMADLRARGIGFEHDEPQQGFDWLVVTLDPSDTFVPMQIVEDEKSPEARGGEVE